MIIIIIIKKL